jgi:hypothetical protein
MRIIYCTEDSQSSIAITPIVPSLSFCVTLPGISPDFCPVIFRNFVIGGDFSSPEAPAPDYADWASAVSSVFDVRIITPRIIVAAMLRTNMVLFVLYVIM